MSLYIKKIIKGFVVAILLSAIFIPNVKAVFFKRLIDVGFFVPEIEKEGMQVSNLSGITFKDRKGNTIDLGKLKGKVVFLNIWATWCPPCRAEMPSLNKLFKQFKNDSQVVFIFADADGNLQNSEQFMADRKYEMPVYRIESTVPPQIFRGALPTTIIFDQAGRLSFKHEGIANYAHKKFVDFINQLKETP